MISALSAAVSFTSCSLFSIDNYEGPEESLCGAVTDRSGNPVLTDQGTEGIRVRLTETSWTSGKVTPIDFYAMPDGCYRNTKIFEGTYNVRVDGPFVPIVVEDAIGNVLEDNSVTLEIKGEKTVDFQVDPFLNVEIVGVSVSNGKVIAKIKVNRGISREDLRNRLKRTDDYEDSYADVTDVQLFVGYSSSMGYRNRDARWSSSLNFSGDSFDDKLGKTVTIESSGSVPSGRKVFVRAAARINYDTPRGSGIRRWNYSSIEEIIVP